MTNGIRLVIADVDGTLVTQEKVLTAGAIKAVQRLRSAGIAFSITSGRPPLGMKMLVDPLGLTEPMGNASPEVQHEAQFVTSSNEEEGFATAMDAFVLGEREFAEKAS